MKKEKKKVWKPKPIDFIIGENVRRHREALGWTQEDLAEHSGIVVGHIGHIEQFRRGAGKRAIEAFAQAFGVAQENITQKGANVLTARVVKLVHSCDSEQLELLLNFLYVVLKIPKSDEQ